jgi:hypothetical protein
MSNSIFTEAQLKEAAGWFNAPAKSLTFEQSNDLARAQRCYGCGKFVGHRKSHEDKRCLDCRRSDVRGCSICRRPHGADVVHSNE